jgi:26S proteasome regulatory subunit N3
LFTLIITTLLKNKLFQESAQYADLLVERIRTFNRRSLDLFSSKAFFYFSLAHEHLGLVPSPLSLSSLILISWCRQLEGIRPILINLYRTACLHHDEMGQAVLLNLILRNFLHYDLIQSANTFASKITFPENASNNQFCRFLYSMGRIQVCSLWAHHLPDFIVLFSRLFS